MASANLASCSAISAASSDAEHVVWFDRPATAFQESLLLGNGRIGAMVFGDAYSERIVLNENSLWSGSPQDADRPGAAEHLPAIRKLLLEGRNAEAEALVNQHFTCLPPGSGKANGARNAYGSYQVLGNLRLDFGGRPQFTVSAGHEGQPGEGVERASDANLKNKWCVIADGRPVRWQVTAPAPVRLERYQLTSANDVPERDPRTWRLEGSNDGTTWTVLDERRDQAPFASRHQTVDFPIARPAAFSRYRLTFEPTPGVSHFQVAEITLPGVSTPPDTPAAYRRSLDLREARASVTYEKNGVRFERSHFISAPDQVFVTALTASRSGALTFSVGLDRPERFQTRSPAPRELLMSGTVENGKGGDGLAYAARLRVLPVGGTVTLNAAGDRLQVTGADRVLILLSAATDFRGFAGRQTADPLAATAADLDRAQAKGFPKLLADHLTDHAALYGRASISLGTPAQAATAAALPTDRRLQAYAAGADDPALAALYFNFGRHLLLGSSRSGGLPANLQGLWSQDIQTPWNGDYHLNINVQMNYWPALVSGLAETQDPLDALIASLVEPGTRTAKIYYGSRGWVAHMMTNVWGFTAPGEQASWGSTAMGSGWLVQHLWNRYDYTRDRAYLARIYPLLKGASEFYLDNLIEEPTHGWLVTGPSNSPENAFINARSQRSHVCLGPTIDLQQLRELFGNTARAAELLGLDPDFRADLLAKRARLAPNQIAPDGRLQEWLEPYKEPEPRHRHVSHLFGLHPYHEITLEGTPALAAAARKTLDARGDDGTGWSLAWKVNFWARLGDGDRALKLIRRLLAPVDGTVAMSVDGHGAGSSINLLCFHPPFQIDGNFGGAAGVAELLLQSHPESGDPAAEPLLRLLPALPSAWPEGSVRGLRARGGYVVDFTWQQGRVVSYRIAGAGGGTVRAKINGEIQTLPVEPLSP